MILLVLIGCPRKTTPVTPVPTEADADTDADADADADTDADTDTDTDTDLDGDGHPAGEDCDDHDPHAYPGANERCDGRDNDCDGEAPFEDDADADGVLDCQTCGDAGWFIPTGGRTGSDLQAVLRDLMEDQDCNDYGDARIFMFNELDIENGQVECVYTGVLATPDGGTTAGQLNTEHTWPQSQGAGSHPARCDLHHLYPTEGGANSRRSNHPFGVVHNASWTDQSVFGTDIDDVTVFEPRDAHKGNVARSLMYFGTQYDLEIPADYLSVLRDWHEADPVDARELARTLAIEQEQGAANAFVVCPHLADAL